MDQEDQEHFRTIAAALPVLPIGSLKKPNGANSNSSLDPAYLLNRARLLFSCYRRDEANEPETYCAAVAAILGDGYSAEVVNYVTDPRTGIPSNIKFLPTIAEVREACDERSAYLDRMRRYAELKPVAPKPPAPLKANEIDYTTFLKNANSRGENPRPIGAFERGGYLGAME